MSAIRVHRLQRLFALGISIFVLSGLILPASVSGAFLAVWFDGGQQQVHDLAIVEQLNFADNELRVVTASCTYRYPMESIVWMDFLGGETGVEDPIEDPDDDMADIIKAVHLFQNYPNPFNPETQIKFKLPERGRVKLCIYSANGQLVCTLIERNMAAGPHSVRWDGVDEAGHSVASGVYFYSLKASKVRESRKMILLR